MPQPTPLDFWESLKRRKLVQWTLGYAAGAFALLQLLAFIAEQFDWNPDILRAATLVFGAGLLVVIVLAWYHGEQGRQRVGVVEALLLVLVIGVGAFAASRVWEDERPTTEATSASIAVLPFANLSADRENEYFSDGITDEITDRLMQTGQLKVAARTSSFAFKGSRATIDSIARTLHVQHVLEGSIRKIGSRVRVKAQLIDARNGYQVWSDTYDREVADVFAIQDSISKAIADALEVRLSGVQRDVVTNARAYDHYLRGRYLLRQADDEGGLRVAIAQLDSARAADPNYAPTYAALTTAYLQLADFAPPQSLIEQTRHTAERAVQLDERDENTRLALANVLWRYDFDWLGAEREFKRAIALNARSAAAHREYGMFLVSAQRPREAFKHLMTAAGLEKARATDPASARIRELRDHTNALYLTGNYRAVIDSTSRLIAIDRGNAWAHWVKAISLSMVGRNDEAIQIMEVADSLYGGAYPWRTHLAWIYARGGRKADAKRILQDLQQRGGRGYVPQDQVAAVYLGLGEVDRGFDALERAVRDRHWWIVQNIGTPLLKDYETHPRYRRFLDLLQFPRGWLR